jgi:hypothetical protein
VHRETVNKYFKIFSAGIKGVLPGLVKTKKQKRRATFIARRVLA